MLQIRYYQEESVLALYDYFAKQTGNPIIALPTGTGKSVVISEWLRSVFCYFPGQRVMILTHVKELIAQNYRKLVDAWPLAPAGIYSAGLGRKEIRPITFAGIASVVKRAADFGHVDMVIIDECHLVSPHDETSYQNFIADLQKVNPKVKVIGLTATPYRLGQGLLTNPIETKKGPRPSLFTDICYNMTGLESFNRLIAEGFLCTLIVPSRGVTKMDVEKVRTLAGEFNLDELQQAVDREEITRRAFNEVEDLVPQMPHASGRARVRWLVFATGIEHTEHVAREIAGRGYNARSVHSKTGEAARDAAVEWFKEETDDLRIIVNNGVFTTGFDCPQLDCIIVLRPTNSPGLWVQILGRGTRPYPGKDNCLVLDFAGNTRRLGPINDPIIPKRKGMKGGGEAPVKICEACGCYNHASVRYCINCNAEFPKVVKFKDRAATDEIIKGSAPVVEIFPVSHVEYNPYFPRNSSKPPSLKVTYSCGKYQKFSEWVCLEHGGYAEGLARKWWMSSTKSAELRSPPKTVEEALTRLDSLREPSHIRVWMNDKHPRVMDRDFSGTAFKTQPAQNSGKPEEMAVQ